MLFHRLKLKICLCFLLQYHVGNGFRLPKSDIDGVLLLVDPKKTKKMFGDELCIANLTGSTSNRTKHRSQKRRQLDPKKIGAMESNEMK